LTKSSIAHFQDQNSNQTLLPQTKLCCETHFHTPSCYLAIASTQIQVGPWPSYRRAAALFCRSMLFFHQSEPLSTSLQRDSWMRRSLRRKRARAELPRAPREVGCLLVAAMLPLPILAILGYRVGVVCLASTSTIGRQRVPSVSSSLRVSPQRSCEPREATCSMHHAADSARPNPAEA